MSEEMKMDAELLPCPFCGGNKISYSTHQIGIAVGCDSCGAVCEIKGSKAQCAEAWNRRASLPVGVPDDRTTLLYLMDRFDNEEWNCPRCGHSESTSDMDSAIHLRQYLAAAPSAPAGEAVPVDGVKPVPEEWRDKTHLVSILADVVGRERMRRDRLPDLQFAEVIYKAIGEHLPIYEDVYDQCSGIIEPYVARPHRPDGMLPGSVVDSLRMLLEYRVKNQQLVGGDSVSVAQDEDWSVFIGYLIDKCEGHEIAEERLQGWLSEMLADPHYGALFRREKQPCNMPSAIELAIQAAEEEHGGLRAAAKALGVDAGYLSRLKSGEKLNPSEEVLAALGLERVVAYRALLSRNGNGGE